MKLSRCLVVIGTVIVVTLLKSEVHSAAPPERDYWPTESWRQAYPEAQGMDSKRLLGTIAFIIENQLEIQSILVVRNGYIVFENYYGLGMPHRQDTVHSVTKSITSALMGIAKDQGFIGNLDQPLAELLPEYFKGNIDPRKKAITLKHLLTMTAGLQPVRVENRSIMVAWSFADDRVQYALDLPLVAPPRGEVCLLQSDLSHIVRYHRDQSKDGLAGVCPAESFQTFGHCSQALERRCPRTHLGPRRVVFGHPADGQNRFSFSE